VFLEATFGQKATPREMAMKDYILGSEEYIITSMEIVAKTIRDCAAPEQRNIEQEEGNEQQENTQNTADQGYTFNQPEKGITALHTLNTLIQKLQQEHNKIAKEKSKAEGRKLQEASRALLELKKQLKKRKKRGRTAGTC
jgi:putative cell wall-binding protein